MVTDVNARPALLLTVGLPGVGKTTRAKELASTHRILRLTPDEWMAPLFGHNDADGRRDILEGRMIWVAHEVLASGSSVVLDFGCWSADERYASDTRQASCPTSSTVGRHALVRHDVAHSAVFRRNHVGYDDVRASVVAKFEAALLAAHRGELQAVARVAERFRDES
jgi:predicted kinase